jgi:hypothetical protein
MPYPSSPSTCTYVPHHATSAPCYHPHQHFFTSLTPHPSPFLRPIALHSYHPNPTHDSNAPRRRLAAGGATQQLRGSTAGSLALAGTSPSSRHGCRAPRVPPTATRVAVPPCLGRPVRVHMSSVRPSSVRRPAHVQRPAVQCPASGTCPVSGVRYMSSVRAPGVRASDIQCRVRVQCPVRASGIRVHFVRTGEFVERLAAAGSHTPRDRPAG